MNIMNFIAWFILYGNSLFGQGCHYDFVNSQFVCPPPVVSRPLTGQQEEILNGVAPRRQPLRTGEYPTR